MLLLEQEIDQLKGQLEEYTGLGSSDELAALMEFKTRDLGAM